MHFIPRKLALFPDEHQNVLSEDCHTKRDYWCNMCIYASIYRVSACIDCDCIREQCATAGCPPNEYRTRENGRSLRIYLCVFAHSYIQRMCVFREETCTSRENWPRSLLSPALAHPPARPPAREDVEVSQQQLPYSASVSRARQP